MYTFQLRDKNILVTGVGGFLGSNLRNALVSEGANIIGTDVESQPNTHKLDISDADAVDKFVIDLASKKVTLDGIVNNAAVSFKGFNITDEQFEKTMRVNIQGTYNCITKFKPLMNKGSIVNIASIFGFLSPDYKVYDYDSTLYNSSAYGATKAGIIQMTKYYAVHYAPSIRVNAASPGGIWQNHKDEFFNKYSERVPMGRMAQVEEIVQPILFLLSPISSYITGHNLIVDGGLSSW